MAGVFQPNVFQNNVFQVDVVVPADLSVTDTEVLQLPVDYYMEGLPQYQRSGRTFEPGRGEAKTEGKIGKSGRRLLTKERSTFTTRVDNRGYD